MGFIYVSPIMLLARGVVRVKQRLAWSIVFFGLRITYYTVSSSCFQHHRQVIKVNQTPKGDQKSLTFNSYEKENNQLLERSYLNITYNLQLTRCIENVTRAAITSRKRIIHIITQHVTQPVYGGSKRVGKALM